jgi:hypothetical protein
MSKQQLLAAMVNFVLERHPPKTQYDCCLIGARCSVALGDIPRNDTEFIEAAHGAAEGLFGPAFEAADYAQKSAWIDMCERALRETCGKKI